MDSGQAIRVSEPDFRFDDASHVARCYREGWISARGPWVERFEAAVAERVGRRFAIAVCNGSAALDVAVAALGIGAGDEVILPAHTILCCAEAVIHAGATPILAESDAASWGLDGRDAAARFTPRTRAVIAPHLYGLPLDLAPLLDAAARAGVAVIEDASQMLGASCHGRPCGSLGTVSTLSFFANKNVTTGEGGMVLTDDPAIAERARALREHGAQPDRRFVHESAGWNYRLTSPQAALGLDQLEGLDARMTRKRAIGLRYRELLADVTELELPAADLPQGPNSYWACGMLLRGAGAADVDRLLAQLAEVGIEGRPFFWPLHLQPVYRRQNRFANMRLPIAEKLSQQGFYLPNGAGLTPELVSRVCTAVQSILAQSC